MERRVVLPSMLELDENASRGYPVQVELENGQIRRKTVAVYMLVGV